MRVLSHVILGGIISLLIFLLAPDIAFSSFLVIFVSSVLIDIDHYLSYAITNNDLNFVRMCKYQEKRMKVWEGLSRKQKRYSKHDIIIFHGIEFFLLVAAIALFYELARFILIGISIHMILDFIDLYFSEAPFYVKSSQLYLYFKDKDKKSY